MSLNDVTVAQNYKTGGSVLNVKGMSLILPGLNIIPNQITVYQASTYGTRAQMSGVYSITRASASVIGGLSLVSGTDGPWVVGDLVELQITAPAGTGTGSVTQINTAGLIGGGPFTTTGTIALANGTANTLIGYGASGAPSGITMGAGVTLVAGVLSAGSASPGGSTGQLQINSSGSFAGVTVTGDFTINSSGVGTTTKTNGVPFAPSAIIDTTNAANISSGVMAIARLPAFGASGSGHSAGLMPDPGPTLGTTRFACEDGTFKLPPAGTGTVNAGSTGQIAVYPGSGTAVQGAAVSTLSIASSQVTGLAASATTDTTVATNITSGTLPAAQLPNPSSSTKGGVQSAAAVSHNFITSISTSGVPVLAQPAFTDVSGTAAATQLPVVGLTLTQTVKGIIVPSGTSGTITLNLALGDVFTPAAMTGNVTLALASPPTSGVVQRFTVFMTQAASGGPFSLTHFSGIIWVGNSSAPAMPTTASAVLEMVFEYVSSGVIYGHFIGVSGTDPSSGTIIEISQTTSFTAVAGAFYAISGSSAVTATLPTAVGINGQTIRIRCASGYTGQCTITGTSGQTIGGQTSQIVYVGESPLLQSDGANWTRTGGTVIPCGCRLTLGTSQPITSPATETLVECNTISPGSDNSGQMGGAASVSNEITIFRPGRYQVTISAFIGAISTSQPYNIQIQAFKNGASISIAAQLSINPVITTAPSVELNCTALVSLAAGDLLTLVCLQVNPANTTESLSNGEVTSIQAIEIPAW